MRTAVLVAALVALPACGGEPGGTSGPEPSAKTQRELHLVAGHDRPEEPCASSERGVVELTAGETFFSPACLEAREGQRLVLRNEGHATHNLTIRAAAISVDVASGERARTRPLPTRLAAGDHEFFCRFHTAAGMVGTLTIA